MIRRNLLFVFIFIACIAATYKAHGVVKAQQSTEDLNDVWKYYSFKQLSSPTTHALNRKGQLRFELSPLFQLPSKFEPIFNKKNSDERGNSDNITIDGSFNGIRVNICYTPWERITLEASMLFTYTTAIGHVINSPSLKIISVNNISRHQIYSSNYKMGELSGTYHANITNYLAYEFRTAISLGNGTQTYNMSYGSNQWSDRNASGYYSYKNDKLRYNIFNHSFVGGLSIFTPRRTLQASLLVDVGYTTYFNKQLEHPFYSRQLYDQVIAPFNRNPWDLYCAPWFMLSINTPSVFSIRFHYGFEVSKQHRRYDSSPLRSTVGVTLSWRIIKVRMVPKE